MCCGYAPSSRGNMDQKDALEMKIEYIWERKPSHSMKHILTVLAAMLITVAMSHAQGISEERFADPEKSHYPQTWFHFIDGNVDKDGITEDLQAISEAGISGIHFFHGGQFGGDWPGVRQHIECLSPMWDDALTHTASEAKRLGLKFTMQNCPGWSLAGGPWIKPEDSMRDLVCSVSEFTGGRKTVMTLPVPVKESESAWRDYRDVAVLAFPTPEGGSGSPAVPVEVSADSGAQELAELLSGKEFKYTFASAEGQPHRMDVTFGRPVTLRSFTLKPEGQFNHRWCFELGTRIKVIAIAGAGRERTVLDEQVPMLNWQDIQSLTFALDESSACRYRIFIDNAHDMQISGMTLTEAARKNNWEAQAARTLRGHIYGSEHPSQSPEAFVRKGSVTDISSCMDAGGTLTWDAPEGNWTVLRIGHVNTGYRNAPAPKEATGWECNKLSSEGADKHFAGYIGRAVEGPVKGRLDAMLLDSWECNAQTWTEDMESEFAGFNGYALRGWMPALFGFVMEDHETTFRFLNDWRACINHLFTEEFWGRMASNAAAAGIGITYETAAGDVFPADILEYFKYADTPMCEFWNDPDPDSFVGSLNFKPVKPTASAAHLYGKKRVAAESLTSFNLTWDEHFSRWKDLINQNAAQGVTFTVFHTYTHNPCADTLFPGTSFGSGIGSPFLRSQTWWKHMPEFTKYLARLSYMLESGDPVSDVLWYLGDGNMHKPDQNYPFPAGYKYDYCNQDILLHRLSVSDGRLVTPEGISYSVLWMPDNHHMLPATAAKVRELVEAGATVIGDAPLSIATLVTSAGAPSACGADTAGYGSDIAAIWGNGSCGIRKVGAGRLICGLPLDEALEKAGIGPDVLDAGSSATDANWLHRHAEGADWYFVTAPLGKPFSGTLDVRCAGEASIWDPVSGTIRKAAAYGTADGRTRLDIDLPYAGCCFVIFDRSKPSGKPSGNSSEVPSGVQKTISTISLDKDWALSFPEGWGAPERMETDVLKPWKDLDISEEGKAFSGTATYSRTIDIKRKDRKASYLLKLGQVEQVAKVYVNGQEIRTLWCEPYEADITQALHKGKNELVIEVTGTWFNRLVYDAGRPEQERKTWVISGPGAGEPLRASGLLGPVSIEKKQ